MLKYFSEIFLTDTTCIKGMYENCCEVLLLHRVVIVWFLIVKLSILFVFTVGFFILTFPATFWNIYK